jgi:hypothetical protein
MYILVKNVPKNIEWWTVDGKKKLPFSKYKASWAPSGFKVSLSLVEYAVKNFRKCFCRNSCNESMAYYNHGLHTGYISLCCRMNPAFPIPFL